MTPLGPRRRLSDPQCVHAQDDTNGAASGRVTDEDGKAIAGATVSITSSDRGGVRSAVTSDTGAYSIPQLAPGSYDFTVTAEGYAPYKEAGVSLVRSTGAANSFTLLPANAGDAIIVRGSRIRVADFEDATTGATIHLGEIDQRVPLARPPPAVVLMRT